MSPGVSPPKERFISPFSGLYIKEELNNVSVFHFIFFSFGTQQSLLPGGGFTAAAHQIVKRDNAGTDKSPFKV